MSDQIEIVIDGIDKTSDAVDSARDNMDKLTGGIQDVGKSSKETAESTSLMDKQMESLNDGAKDAIQSLTGLSVSSLTAGGAIVALAEGLKQSVEEFIDTTDEMRKLSNLTGDSVSEVSRLGDVAEKTGVSMGTLTMALQAADRKGVSPSIEGLEKLSDQYLALAPGVERAHFLMENFGRGGADLANIMELGSSGIKEMAGEVGNLEITTQAMVEEDKQWKAATAELGDQVKGPMMQAGYQLVSMMNSIIKVTQDGTMEFKPWAAVIDYATQKVSEQRSAERDLQSQRLEGMGAMYAEIDAYKSIPTEAGNASASLADYADKMGYAADQTQVFHDRQQYMMDDLKTQQAGLADVTASFGKLTTAMLYNKAAAGLNEDDAAHLAVSMGLLDSKTYEYLKTTEDLNAKLHAGDISMDEFTKDMQALNAVTKDTGTTANKIQLDKMFKDGLISATEYKIKLQELRDQINGLTDKTVTVNVDIVGGTILDDFTKKTSPVKSNKKGYATGADFIVPEGYYNDNYPISVQSGEHVTVTPEGKTPKGSGATLVINNYGAPPDISQAMMLLNNMLATGV